MSELSVELLDVAKHPLALRFYKDAKSKTRIASHDRIVVGRQDNRIVAAYRLSPLNDDLCLLRNMLVVPELQRTGLGHTLLNQSKDHLSSQECWCFPFSHLDRFYGNCGFIVPEEANIPDNVRDKYQRYRNQGRNIIVMRYSN